MKQRIAILLLVSLMAPFWGTFIFLQHNRNKIKKEIAIRIITGMDGDTTWYYCYKDDKETRLNNEKYQLLARSMGQDPSQKNTIGFVVDDLFYQLLNSPSNVLLYCALCA